MLARLLALALLTGCAATVPRPQGAVRYVGSSTVARFVEDAAPVYGAIEFTLDTGPESAGAEAALLAGRADLAGIARAPRPEARRAGLLATLIGRDAIAVVVNPANTVRDLTRSELAAIFTGRVTSWREVGGPDLLVEPFVVGAESATHRVFADAVLAGEPYAGCTEVRPDGDILAAVAGTPGGVGQISLSFLDRRVRAVAVDGVRPDVADFDYPIARPLYLLWREGNPVVESFVAWAGSEAGQRVVLRRFAGVRVVGSVGAGTEGAARGTLVVLTETYPVVDGGIYYYPHRPYELLTRGGRLLRRVPNHRGENDETATRVTLSPGTYLVRTASGRDEALEYFVTVADGETTILDVLELERR